MPLELGGVGEQLVDPGLDRGDELDHRVGGVLLQVAVAAAGIALDQLVDVGAGDRGLDRQQVRHSRLGLGVVADLPLAVGDRRADLLGRHRRIVEQADQPRLAGRRLAHLRRRVLQVVDLGGGLRDHRLGDDEGVGEARVEALRDVAGQFQVLALVLADGHQVGVVEQHVGRLQHRIGEQADRGGVAALLLRLVLELRHPRRLPEAGETAQHPSEFGVGGHVALHEDGRPERDRYPSPGTARRSRACGAEGCPDPAGA